MKKLLFLLPLSCLLMAVKCDAPKENKTATHEQALTEENQAGLLANQPPPRITWSLERDNLIKRFKLENDRSVIFYMYVFIEGSSQPIGYYQVNKISSVNSQLTNPSQLVSDPNAYQSVEQSLVIESPAEDGSYGSNGDGVFGFTPEEIYIEHNMKYIASSVPLHFQHPVNNLALINVQTENQLKLLMQKIDSK